MKHEIYLLSAFLFASAASYAQTSPVSVMNTPSAPKIPFQVKGATLDDALVELGQAAHINFLADATHFSKESSITIDSKVPLEQHLAELDGQSDKSHKLTWLAKGETLLLWTAPDLRPLVQQTLAGQTIKFVKPDSTTSATPTTAAQTTQKTTSTAKTPSKEELLYQELSEYFRTQKDWDEKDPQSVREIKISELPPSLRAKVVAATQKNLFLPKSTMIWQAWFDDNFWKNAEMKVFEDTNGIKDGPKIPVLIVGGSIKIKTFTGGSAISLGAIKETNKG